MTEKEKNLNQKNRSTDEIDLIKLAKTLWNGRRTILIMLGIFAFLGIFVALFTQKEYSASIKMVPQINDASSKMGGLSSLASIAGFNLDMNSRSNELSPVLYPQIVSSTEFQLKIINTKYTFQELDKEHTLFDYYMDYYKPGLFATIKKYTIGIPGIIIKAIKDDENILSKSNQSDSNFIRISRDQDKIIRKVKEKLSLALNDKDGYFILESRFHEPNLSAQIAEVAKTLLQEKITNIKIEKASAQMEFVRNRYEEKKLEFEEAQAKLAVFRDANKNINSAVFQTQETKLENESQLAFEVYSELAKQLEQARIKVKEDTPVFSVIEDIVVPVTKSKPDWSMIMITWLFFGALFGTGIVLGKNMAPGIKRKWEEQDA